MSERLARALALGLLALTGLLALSGLILWLVYPNAEVTHRLWLPYSFLQPVSCALIGGLIVVRQPRNTVGWLLLIIGLDAGALTLTEVYEPIVTANPGAPVGVQLLGRISDLTWVVSIPSVCLILQLFPGGRPLSPRWRYVAWLTGLWVLCGVAVGLLFGSGSGGLGFLLFFALLLLLMLLSVVSILVRTHRASGVERQQLKWLAIGAVPGLLVIPLAATGFPQLIAFQPVFFTWLPVTIGIAVLRNRLYEIDRIISRTISYGVVTAVLVAVYGASVLLLQIPLSQFAPGDSVAVAASTLAAAALFQPVRGVVQRFVDQRFDRARYDGARTVAAFGTRLRNEVDLDSVVGQLQEVVRATIGPSSASVWLRPKRSKRTAGG